MNPSPLLPLPPETIDRLASLCESLFGEPAKELVGMVTDRLQYVRWSNRLKILERVQRRQCEVTAHRQVPPPDFILPALDASGNAFDESLQDLWAQLLDGICIQPDLSSKAFIRALEHFTPTSAALFELMAEATLLDRRLDELQQRFRDFGKDGNDDLVRDLSILEVAGVIHFDGIVAGGSPIRTIDSIVPTTFGGGIQRFGALLFSLISGTPASEFKQTQWPTPDIRQRVSNLERNDKGPFYLD